MTIAFYISAVCLLTEMFFAASEISIISCDRLGLRKLATEGHRSARILETFLSNKQRLLATTLVGSQLSVVVSTVVMTYALHHLFREFQRRKTHLALVVDEYGRLAGLVSMEDLLEELFGEIADEKETRTPGSEPT